MIKSNNMYDLLDYHNTKNDFTDYDYVESMKFITKKLAFRLNIYNLCTCFSEVPCLCCLSTIVTGAKCHDCDG